MIHFDATMIHKTTLLGYRRQVKTYESTVGEFLNLDILKSRFCDFFIRQTYEKNVYPNTIMLLMNANMYSRFIRLASTYVLNSFSFLE